MIQPASPDSMSLSDRCLEELDVTLADMSGADALYRATQFWSHCSLPIVAEMKTKGLQGFKAHDSGLMWYVPSYAKGRERWSRLLLSLRRKGLLPSAKIVRRLEEYLSGRPLALADYRVACAASMRRSPFLQGGESAEGNGLLHQIEGANFGKAALNYVRGLAFLEKTPGYFDDEARTFLEIGGGFGGLGEIVLKNSDQNRYIDIDIPPVLTSATYYLKALFGEDNVYSYSQSRNAAEIKIAEVFAAHRAACLPPWQLENLRGTVDCFVNFVSFQEMEPHVVENYIRKVMPLTRKYVILRNSRHGKKVATDSSQTHVERKTTLDMMINWFSDFRLVDRDSLVFGDESRFGSFKSEVAILVRQKPLRRGQAK